MAPRITVPLRMNPQVMAAVLNRVLGASRPLLTTPAVSQALPQLQQEGRMLRMPQSIEIPEALALAERTRLTPGYRGLSGRAYGPVKFGELVMQEPAMDPVAARLGAPGVPALRETLPEDLVDNPEVQASVAQGLGRDVGARLLGTTYANLESGNRSVLPKEDLQQLAMMDALRGRRLLADEAALAARQQPPPAVAPNAPVSARRLPDVDQEFAGKKFRTKPLATLPQQAATAKAAAKAQPTKKATPPTKKAAPTPGKRTPFFARFAKKKKT